MRLWLSKTRNNSMQRGSETIEPFCVILHLVIVRRSLLFTGPRKLDIQTETLPDPESGEATVQTICSAISPGSEMLIYAGLFPKELAVDESIGALAGEFGYPLKYGYAAVGRVVQIGPGVDSRWLGRLVFAFNPHESHFNTPVDDLQPLPEGLEPQQAVFLPNMETAVNFLMDGKPLIGERVAVLGQGIVGLLTTALLARFPLGALITLDRFELRRQTALQLGAHASLDPEDGTTASRLAELLPQGADLCYELSGSPAALNQAIALTGFAGRIVVGSWYGEKSASLDLGGRFHRSRIQLVSSQVSTLAPEFTGRWSKARRFHLAWKMLEEVAPARFITHRFTLADAAQAYQLLDEQPETAIQILFTYT